MKILMISHAYRPSVGGIETVSALLAREFLRAGHQLTLVTQTLAPITGSGVDSNKDPIEPCRRPSPIQLWRLVHDADLVFHNNISLRAAWPLLLIHKPWWVTQQVWLPRGWARLGLLGRLKRGWLRRAGRIAISQAIATDLKLPAHVIPNPYDADTFRLHPDQLRDRELAFVGRMIHDKGADLLLEALSILGERGLRPGLTLIGDGPQRVTLEQQAVQRGLKGQVHFTGVLQNQALASELNRHRLLVVPSRWAEPFGVVALEGLACGCAVIGSRDGGLGEAIGTAGATFANGDVLGLADLMQRALNDPTLLPRLPQLPVSEHLARHRADRVAAEYLALFQATLRAGPPTIDDSTGSGEHV